MKDRYFGVSNRIANWKECSEFENRFARLAEHNEDVKELYVAYYRHISPEYYMQGKNIARRLVESNESDFNGDDFENIYEDMVYCLHKYGLSFQDYCIYNLNNKSEMCRQSFVSDKLRYYYCDILNSPEIEALMTNKFECYKIYGCFYKRDMVPCISIEEKSNFENFVRNHNRFIFKPLYEHSGHGIEIIDSEKLNVGDWYDRVCTNHPGVVEELIEQGYEMNQINPHVINSCRIVSFTIGDCVTLIGGALRMGVGDAVTDNAGAGGIYASIDTETGIIQTDAKNYNNKHYKYHPTTGIQIIGFQLPQWDEAKDLIRKMALCYSGTTLISWDIAFSNKGWCMVEANDNGDWSIIQSNQEIGKKAELYSLMDRYFEVYKRLQ